MEPLERRAQILRHAARLFGEKGYHSTSISDIIGAAGIARGTFYLYFENKRGIFAELVDDLLARLVGRIRTVDTSPGAPSARRQLLDNITRVLELLSTERPLLAILLKGAVGLDSEFDAKLADFYRTIALMIESSLKLGQRIGLVRACDTRVAALAALGALKEVLLDLLHNETERGEELLRLATEVLDLFDRGVVVEGVSLP